MTETDRHRASDDHYASGGDVGARLRELDDRFERPLRRRPRDWPNWLKWVVGLFHLLLLALLGAMALMRGPAALVALVALLLIDAYLVYLHFRAARDGHPPDVVGEWTRAVIDTEPGPAAEADSDPKVERRERGWLRKGRAARDEDHGD